LNETLTVGVAEIKVSANSATLASFGLGSCVAVAMFDPIRKVGGLAHVMLPEGRSKPQQSNPGKFADTAVLSLFQELLKLGAKPYSLKCKIVGGAQMFEIPGSRSGSPDSRGGISSNIGERNVEAVKKALKELGVPIVAEETGGNFGRTVRFNTSTGELEITSIYHGKVVI